MNLEGDNIRTFVGDKGGINDSISTVNTIPKADIESCPRRGKKEEEVLDTFDEIAIHGKFNSRNVVLFRVMVHANGTPHIGRRPPRRTWEGIHSASRGETDTRSFRKDDDCFVRPQLSGVCGLLNGLLMAERIAGHFEGRPQWGGEVGGGDGGFVLIC